MPAAPAPELWAEHVPAVQLFEAMCTQWRTSAMGGRIGFDYAALPVVEKRLGLGRRVARRAFEYLQLMEATALEWYAARQRRR
jgi:hypothetical protein